MAEGTTFDSRALVEIYGHQKYAGRVTEQTIGGCNFVRVDIPETPDAKPFTKLFGQGAIFSITPIEEDVARHLAKSYGNPPVAVYELPRKIRDAVNAARGGQSRIGTDEPDFGGGPDEEDLELQEEAL